MDKKTKEAFKIVAQYIEDIGYYLPLADGRYIDLLEDTVKKHSSNGAVIREHLIIHVSPNPPKPNRG